MAEKRDLKTPAAASSERAIDEWRRRIDMIDEQLMRLLNSRSACAVEIGKVKRALGLPVYSPEREAWILERVMRENPGPLDPTAVRRVFERIIDESRRLERLAVDQGKKGGRTHGHRDGAVGTERPQAGLHYRPRGIHSREGGILMDASRRGRVCIPTLPSTPSIGMN